jgi:type III secretory pathway component EscT
MAPGLLETLLDAFDRAGWDLAAWALAWARFAPALALVPAFGLRALPAPVRIALGLALALTISPALEPIAAAPRPFALSLITEVGKGLPVALSAATLLWVATMTGGLIDDLRGAREPALMPSVEPGSTPVGALFAMLAAILFLESGGPARVAAALAVPELSYAAPLTRAATNLAASVELAIAIAAPVVAAAIVVELASALIARAASPAFIQPLLAPLRSLVLLGVVAVALDRMLEFLALGLARGP